MAAQGRSSFIDNLGRLRRGEPLDGLYDKRLGY